MLTAFFLLYPYYGFFQKSCSLSGLLKPSTGHLLCGLNAQDASVSSVTFNIFYTLSFCLQRPKAILPIFWGRWFLPGRRGGFPQHQCTSGLLQLQLLSLLLAPSLGAAGGARNLPVKSPWSRRQSCRLSRLFDNRLSCQPLPINNFYIPKSSKASALSGNVERLQRQLNTISSVYGHKRTHHQNSLRYNKILEALFPYNVLSIFSTPCHSLSPDTILANVHECNSSACLLQTPAHASRQHCFCAGHWGICAAGAPWPGSASQLTPKKEVPQERDSSHPFWASGGNYSLFLFSCQQKDVLGYM